MLQTSPTPSITVAIGRHTRMYSAFVTTAPVELDAPATVTLYAAALWEVAGFAADPIPQDRSRGLIPARLVLVDATELTWQQARYRAGHHVLLSADPGLVGLNTLQHWLWQRLQGPVATEAHA